MSQRLHRYGYRGSKDPRLPEEHICYWCLLSDAVVYGSPRACRPARYHVPRAQEWDHDEDRIVKNLRYVSVFKRYEDFTDHHTSMYQASRMCSMMKKSGFVTQAGKSRKPRYRATGKALFVPVQNSATVRKLLEIYFDPMMHISHHVGVFVTSSISMEVAD